MNPYNSTFRPTYHHLNNYLGSLPEVKDDWNRLSTSLDEELIKHVLDYGLGRVDIPPSFIMSQQQRLLYANVFEGIPDRLYSDLAVKFFGEPVSDAILYEDIAPIFRWMAKNRKKPSDVVQLPLNPIDALSVIVKSAVHSNESTVREKNNRTDYG